jgi:serine protease inhibitor
MAAMEMCMKPLLSSLIVCLALQEATRLVETAPSATADRGAVVEGNNAFAVELYSQLRNPGGDLFFSPESIFICIRSRYQAVFAGTRSMLL